MPLSKIRSIESINLNRSAAQHASLTVAIIANSKITAVLIVRECDHLRIIAGVFNRSQSGINLELTIVEDIKRHFKTHSPVPTLRDDHAKIVGLRSRIISMSTATRIEQCNTDVRFPVFIKLIFDFKFERLCRRYLRRL